MTLSGQTEQRQFERGIPPCTLHFSLFIFRCKESIKKIVMNTDVVQMDNIISKQIKNKKLKETKLKAHLNDEHPLPPDKISFKV